MAENTQNSTRRQYRIDEENEQIVNQHIRQHQEEFKEKKQNNLTD